jgi:hypothetical protein
MKAKVQMMKLLLVISLLFYVGVAQAKEITLRDGTHVVPKGKVWLIRNVPPNDCRICTADINFKPGINNVEIDGVVMHGEFTLSFREVHGEVKLHAGTTFFLGDSRPELVIHEEEAE